MGHPFRMLMIPILALMGVTSQAAQTGVLLENLTWQEAETVLGPDTVVVIPLGAGAKEHGPHLPLKNDFLTAEYLKRRVLESSQVVMAPTVNYGYYPAFLEYPGSVSLRLETSRDMLVDICRSLAGYGPRRFYVINTGVSTLAALGPAAETLAAEGIVLHFTNILTITAAVEEDLSTQEGGTHADEIETSMMLYIAPDSVQMARAVKDFNPDRPGPLTRDPQGNGVYSPTGSWGDPTLATREKGEQVTEVLVRGLLAEIEILRNTGLPGAGGKQ